MIRKLDIIIILAVIMNMVFLYHFYTKDSIEPEAFRKKMHSVEKSLADTTNIIQSIDKSVNSTKLLLKKIDKKMTMPQSDSISKRHPYRNRVENKAFPLRNRTNKNTAAFDKLDLLLIKQHVENFDHRIAKAKTKLDLAILLRNHVYANVPLERTKKNFNFNNLYRSYNLSAHDPEYGHICGGLAMIYMTVCEAFGIPSRYVGLFDSVKAPYNSHATVEIFIDGKWIASDPTFNVMHKDDDRYLNYAQMREKTMNKNQFKTVTNGMPVFKNRLIENYPVPLEDYLKYVVCSQAATSAPGNKNMHHPHIRLPKKWDGVITLESGRRITMPGNSIFYRTICRGILR